MDGAKEMFLKVWKTQVFCSKNEWLIQNQGLGWQSDTICTKSVTKNNENTPQFIQPKIWDM